MTDIQRYVQGVVELPGVNITSHPRCGDADRQRASDRIGEAYARGFLEKEEAEARRDAVARCTLAAHLEELVRDIPAMTRFKGASLPVRHESRAELLVKWWQCHQPWSSAVALIAGLIEAITPGVVTSAVHVSSAWVNAAVAISVPPGAVVVIMAFCALMSWAMEL